MSDEPQDPPVEEEVPPPFENDFTPTPPPAAEDAFPEYEVSLGVVIGHTENGYLVRTPEGAVVGIGANGTPSEANFANDLANPPGALDAAKAVKSAAVNEEALQAIADGATLTGAQYGTANGKTFGITNADRFNWVQLSTLLDKAKGLGSPTSDAVETVLGAPILDHAGAPVTGVTLAQFDYFLLGVGAAYGQIWGTRAMRLAAIAAATTVEEVNAI